MIRSRVPVAAAIANLGWPPVNRACIERALSKVPAHTLRVLDSSNDAAFACLRHARSGRRRP